MASRSSGTRLPRKREVHTNGAVVDTRAHMKPSWTKASTLTSAIGCGVSWPTPDTDFASAPRVLPAGQSLVWSLAKATGNVDDVLRYPGEDGAYEAPKMDALGL